MLSLSIPSSYNYEILILGQDICGSASTLVRRNICNFDLLASLSVLFRTVRCVFFCVWALLWCLFPGLILGLPVWYSSCSLGRIFCCFCCTTFSTSKSFSFSILSHIFLSVIDVIHLDISNSVLISGGWHSFSNSINFSQWSSGVSVSVCFAQKNLLMRWVVFVSFRWVTCVV